jgi:hypothetical protein
VKKANFFRGERQEVTTLLSAFGRNKEVNLTAYLAYIIHLHPSFANSLFGIKGTVQEVFVERSSKSKDERYDIILRTEQREYTLEAKLGHQSMDQIDRYLSNRRNLFLIGESFGRAAGKRVTGFISWDALAQKFRKFNGTASSRYDFIRKLTKDFVRHLEEQAMARTTTKDVYVRDLSGTSVQLYFEHGLYRCQATYFNSASKCRYFAPYLTKSNERGDKKSLYHILGVGISFFSKIRQATLVKVKDVPSELRKQGYSAKEVRAIMKIFDVSEKQNQEISLLFLEPHIRITHKPVTKKDLWGHSGGAMPSMGIDFGDLMAAANGLLPLKKTG